jgi:hypothetical protein
MFSSDNQKLKQFCFSRLCLFMMVLGFRHRQGLVLARQVLYHLSHTSSPNILIFFFLTVLEIKLRVNKCSTTWVMSLVLFCFFERVLPHNPGQFWTCYSPKCQDYMHAQPHQAHNIVLANIYWLLTICQVLF